MSQNNKNNNAPRQRSLNLNMATKRPGIEDLIDHTDTEDSSSSSSNTQVFEHSDPFVLELHELTRDELPDNPLPEVKTRRLLKKKKKRDQLPANQSESSLPSSSASESSSVAPTSPDVAKEEYYDAHESYHGLSAENHPSSAVASAAVAQVLSEHGHEPKLVRSAQEPATPAHSTREPSTITKPVTPPE